MKTTIATLIAVLALGIGAGAQAESPPASTTIVLAGGAARNDIKIWLTPDGYSYVIDSGAPLEVGGTICQHPAGNPNELVCEAPPIAGFVVNGGSHDDSVVVARAVPVPVTLRGGPGNDTLLGGGGNDLILGGPGNDVLGGRGGDDSIFGGPGKDLIKGGPGDDTLHGGPGRDQIVGGAGTNKIVP
jgi:Ca2+-binding RTX toxin-like protein